MLINPENINVRELERTVLKISGNELSKLSEPCYYPSLKIGFYEFLDQTKLSENEVKQYVKTYWGNMPEKSWKLHNDIISIFMIEMMKMFLTLKREIGFQSTMLLYMIRIYTNLMNKQIKFCNKDVFKYTLEHLNKTHLFHREGSISNAIYYMANLLDKKYKNDILKDNKKGISKFITESRHRISQSVKSFAETYYQFHKEGKGASELSDTYATDEEGSVVQTGTPEASKLSIFIDKLLGDIIAYRSVDESVFAEAKKLTGVSDEWIKILREHMFEVGSREYIKHIFLTFLPKFTTVNDMCSKRYYDIVKELMFIKRSTELMYFKKEVITFALYLIKMAEKEAEFRRLPSTQQYKIYYFIAYSITLILRKRICR